MPTFFHSLGTSKKSSMNTNMITSLFLKAVIGEDSYIPMPNTNSINYSESSISTALSLTTKTWTKYAKVNLLSMSEKVLEESTSMD